MPFFTELKVQKTYPDGWLLTEPLTYVTHNGRTITVPAGFQTDFASVPRLPLIFVLMGDTNHRAAVIHDYLYSTKEVSRKEADSIFVEAMEGPKSIQSRLMYLGVRLFGSLRWNQREAPEPYNPERGA
jgi:hypothetical protein